MLSFLKWNGRSLILLFIIVISGCSVLGSPDGDKPSARDPFFHGIGGGSLGILDVLPGTVPIDYLCFMMDRFHTNFSVFIDGNSAGNNFNALGFNGFQGDTNKVTMNCYWNTDPHSGLDCLKVTVQPLSGSFGGYYFLNGTLSGTETSPSLNWGSGTNAGINLTGATKLTFWAKGQNGGENIQFFALGSGRSPSGGTNNDPNTGLPYPYPDSNPKIGTNITLTSSWQQYTIWLTNANLNYVLGAFGFAALQQPSEQVFYLDDIAFDGPSRLNEPRFLVSYYMENSGWEFDKVCRNMAYTYDNALAVMAFIASGSQYQGRAKLVLDAFSHAITNDRKYGPGYYDGRVRNAYQAGAYKLWPGWNPNGKSGTIRMPGFWNADNISWNEDSYSVGIDAGNVAWLMLAYLTYIQTYPTAPECTTYKTMVGKLGDFVINYLKDTRYTSKGFDGSFASIEGNWEPGELQTYRSTEHNMDLYAAFARLAQVDPANATKWNDAADHAKTFVLFAWGETQGLFYTGTGFYDDLVTSPDNEFRIYATDAQAWALLALRLTNDNYYRGLYFAEGVINPSYKSVIKQSDTVWGFDYNISPPVYDLSGHPHPDGMWFEGMGQMATAYMYAGMETKAVYVLNGIQTGIGAGGGVYVANPVMDDFITTGFIYAAGPWYYYHRLGVAPTAWAIIAQNRINAFWYGTSNGIIPTNSPPCPMVTVFYPKTNSVVYSGSPFTVTGAAFGSDSIIAGVYLKMDSGSYGLVNGTNDWSTNLTFASGSHTLYIYAVNTGGKYSATNSLVVKGTNVLPVLKITNCYLSAYGTMTGVTPENYKINVSVINYYGSYPRPMYATPDTTILTDGSWTCSTWGYPGDGCNLVKACLNPVSGGGMVTETFYYRNDSAAPVLDFQLPSNTTNSLSNFTLSGNVSDDANINGVYYSLNGSAFSLIPGSDYYPTWNGTTNATILTNLKLLAGSNTIRIFADDDTAHRSATNTYNVHMTIRSQAIAKTSWPISNTTVYSGAAYTVSGTGDSNETISAVYMKLDSGTYKQVIGTYSWYTNFNIPSGSHYIYVYAKDQNGIAGITNCVRVTGTTTVPVLKITNCGSYAYGTMTGVTATNYYLNIYVCSTWGSYIRPGWGLPSETLMATNGAWSCANVGVGYPGDGCHLVAAYMYPRAGGSVATSGYFYRNDVAIPVLMVTTPPKYYTNAVTNITISGSFTDDVNVNGVYVSLNSGTYRLIPGTDITPSVYGTKSVSWTTNLWLKEGSNNIRFYGKDDANRQTSVKTYVVFMTKTTPLSYGLVTDNAPFGNRRGHQVVSFNGSLWMICGRDTSEYGTRLVYNSPDGTNWSLVNTNAAAQPFYVQTSDAPFFTRNGHQVVVFNNHMWMIGGYRGYSDGTWTNDVWYTADGTNWTLATAAAGFSGRMDHQVVVYNNKMWVIGGYENFDGFFNGYHGDVWSSSDGTNWTQATASAAFGPRTTTAMVYNNKMWVIAGNTGGSYYHDVWSSTNGVDWTCVSSATPFSIRNTPVVTYNNKMMAFGGYGPDIVSDVWSTADGITWSQETTMPTARGEHTVTLFNNSLWIVGGYSGVWIGDIYNCK